MAVAFILYTVFMGHFNFAKSLLIHPYSRAIGKICFEAALVTPIVITLLYFGQDNSVYLTNPNSLIFGTGHIVVTALVGFLLFIFVEYPLQTAINILISNRLSHAPMLREKYLQ